ncbi:MAG: hypothetical protein ACRDGD_04555 [Candidatus Limnocylindria bacterium]
MFETDENAAFEHVADRLVALSECIRDIAAGEAGFEHRIASGNAEGEVVRGCASHFGGARLAAPYLAVQVAGCGTQRTQRIDECLHHAGRLSLELGIQESKLLPSGGGVDVDHPPTVRNIRKLRKSAVSAYLALLADA